ncbi:hypothetical protein Poli38472_007097 [Pythium oligandrum]|uniref:Ankyrin repeat-containing domain n=1 Tax=Pythium oligandrum TaxID=41045 RepID=A0A8K1FGQ5_PYTOL|nr:hypothetical protein Poli38472_007097 [Pythium oligandrum]|eukprot:TMW58952.1 hypothetical protein Poli38472_007097 [Pythium oligandrum]
MNVLRARHSTHAETESNGSYVDESSSDVSDSSYLYETNEDDSDSEREEKEEEEQEEEEEDTGYVFDEADHLAAMVEGNLVKKWFEENRRIKWTKTWTAMDEAAKQGRLDIVQKLHDDGSWPCTKLAMDWAAMNGHLDVVAWLSSARTEGCTTDAMDWAAANGHDKVVRWLCEKSMPGTWHAMEYAALGGFLDVVKTLYDQPAFDNWPQPHDASVLFGLLKTRTTSVLRYIVQQRGKYYGKCGRNPEYASPSQEPPTGPRIDIRGKKFIFTAVAKVCATEISQAPEELAPIISEFIMVNPPTLLPQEEFEEGDAEAIPIPHNELFYNSFEDLSNHLEAAKRGWVFWLKRFSKVRSEDMVIAAEHGQFEAACLMHSYVTADNENRCPERFLYLTVEKGDMELVRWHTRNCRAHSIQDLLYLATWIGREDVVSWMIEEWDEVCTLGSQEAASGANRVMFHSLDASFNQVKERFKADLEGVRSSPNELEEAVEHGKLRDVEYFLTEYPVTSNVCDLAAISGRLRILKHLPELRCTVSGLYGAIIGNHYSVVRYLYRHQPKLVEWPMVEDGPHVLRCFLHVNEHQSNAIREKEKNRKMLDFFRVERGMRLEARDLNEAVFRRDAVRVRMLCELKLVEENRDAISIAAAHGDFDLLKVMCRTEQEFSSDAVNAAAEEGHLEIVQYLHGRGATCPRSALDLAAANGHLDVVEYLLSYRREDYSQWGMYWASGYGHIDVVQCLLAHKIRADLEMCVAVAKMHGHEAVAALFESHRVVYDERYGKQRSSCNVQVDWTTDAMDQAAKHGRLDVVKWLHTNRREGCTKKAMDGAVEEGHYDVVKWLCENRTEGCSSSALVSAMKNGRRDIVALLLEEVESLQNWPEARHATVLAKLIEGSNLDAYQDIVRHREKLYKGNPVNYSQVDAPSTEAETFEFVLPIVSEVTARLSSKLSRGGGSVEIGNTITKFVMDPLKYTTALKDGNVHWLTHFSEHPNEDALLLAKSGNLEGARSLHQNLSVRERLRCRKQFLYVTMETSDIDFIKWHVRECPDHSMEEWLYAATYVGREDVVSWMKESWCTLDQISRNPGGVLLFPNSLEESLSRVEEKFSNVLPVVKKQMSGLEQAAWSGKLTDVRAYLTNSVTTSNNAADLAAIKGKLPALEFLLDEGLTCSVGGLFGAIKGGHVKIVKHLYKHQSDLAKWPKSEDGTALLRRFLNPIQKEMLEFFGRKRNLRLETHDLSQAAFRKNRELVQVLCELQLVEHRHDAIDIAAVRGDDEMLKILYPPGQQCSVRAICGAAEEGHLAMVQHLHTHHAAISRSAIDLAARNGHVEIVRCLLQHGQACSDWAMYWASACGHVDVVRALVEHLVKCDVDKCVEVAMTEEIVAILRDNSKEIEQQNQRSSSYNARKARQIKMKMVRKPSRVIYRELESRIWPNGLPSDLKSGVPPGN